MSSILAGPDTSGLPYITGADSSDECLDKGLNCSIDPATGACTECRRPEGMDSEIPNASRWRARSKEVSSE